VVGKDIFTCESGIHIDGLIKNPSNYEPFDPAEVSLKRKIIIGKKAGKNALRHKLSGLGVRVEENHLTGLLTKLRKRKSFDRTADKAQKRILSIKDGFYGQ
jgi:homocitrate synthase NifV